MSLLPSKPEASPPDDADPRVIGVDSEDADDVLAALSSETARELLTELHDDPASPSELADRVDTSLQNAQYHLEKLESAGAIAVVDTAYSAKGREMDVYAPADQPLVIFAGDDSDSSLLQSALSRLLGAVGVLGVASLAIQQLYGDGSLFGFGSDGGASSGGGDGAAVGVDGGDGGAGAAGTDTPTAEESIQAADQETATEQVTSSADAGSGGSDGLSSDAVTETADPSATPAPEDTVEIARESATEAADSLTETATQTATQTAANLTETPTTVADATREGAAGLPPGLLFFAGGLFAIVVVAGVLALR